MLNHSPCLKFDKTSVLCFSCSVWPHCWLVFGYRPVWLGSNFVTVPGASTRADQANAGLGSSAAQVPYRPLCFSRLEPASRHLDFRDFIEVLQLGACNRTVLCYAPVLRHAAVTALSTVHMQLLKCVNVLGVMLIGSTRCRNKVVPYYQICFTS